MTGLAAFVEAASPLPAYLRLRPRFLFATIYWPFLARLSRLERAAFRLANLRALLSQGYVTGSKDPDEASVAFLRRSGYAQVRDRRATP